MNYVWLFILMVLGAGGYYGYTVLEQKITTDEQQVSDLNTKIASLQSDNKKLEAENASLSKTANDSQAAVSDLTSQLQSTQSALAQAQAKTQAVAPATPAVSAPPPAATPAASTGNKLGTISTLDGKTFQNCQLLKVEADGIVVNHAEGITKLDYGLLPPDLQKRFGYDVHAGPRLNDDQVAHLEQLREAAQATGN